MKIGGLVTCSLVDYPGKIAAVVFTQGCNMNCPWCHNRQLIPLEGDGPGLDESEVLSALQKRRAFLDAVVISGGEPTIQPDLPGFLAQVRDLGFLTKLDTNGSRPDVLKDILNKNLVDFVAMDLKGPLNKYPEICGVCVDTNAIIKGTEIILKSNVPNSFRTVLIRRLTNSDLWWMRSDFPGVRSPILQEYREFAPSNRPEAIDASKPSGGPLS